ncbi:MAG: YggT family protein [Arcanobacterium sp.]|nr:YggT family protein [Arcanobacterium sp.]
MTYVFAALYWVLELYSLILIARVVFDLVQIFVRDFQPQGIVLLLANLIYRLTDPPLRILARYIKPIQFGGVGIDLGFIVLFIGVRILQVIVSQLAGLLL